MKREKQSGFSLWRNLKHSISGLIEVTKNETPMKAEILLLLIGSAIVLFLDIAFAYRVVLFISLFLPLFAELINSAIERVVDLITSDYHELAKAAKDAGSAIVLLALIVTGLIWVCVLSIAYFGG
ncbi:MAG: diacylglycerol kinase [Helicobacteraceae bacterium]|jgi:diacylglycerol kinase (ATP)|nr:diacylglycerol kinase [Helicobacteraceae bacterium]